MAQNDASDSVASAVAGIVVGVAAGVALAHIVRYARNELRPIPKEFIQTLEDLGGSEEIIDTLRSGLERKLVKS